MQNAYVAFKNKRAGGRSDVEKPPERSIRPEFLNREAIERHSRTPVLYGS